MRVLICFALVVLAFSCNNKKALSNELKNEIKDKLGEQWEQTDSPSGDYFLFVQKKEILAKNPQTERKYVVTENNGATVLVEGTISGGYVKWFDDRNIEYFNSVGAMPINASKNDFVYIMDVKTKEQKKKSKVVGGSGT